MTMKKIMLITMMKMINVNADHGELVGDNEEIYRHDYGGEMSSLFFMREKNIAKAMSMSVLD